MPEQSCEMQTVDSDIEAEGGCGLYLEEESSQVAEVDADNQGCSMEQVDQAAQQESSSQLPPGLSEFMVDAAMFVADQMEAEAAAKAEAEAEAEASAADAQVAEPEATIAECELAPIPVPEVATPEAEETPAEAACEIAPEIDDASTDAPVETNESEEIEETEQTEESEESEETEESEESEEASDEIQTESAGE